MSQELNDVIPFLIRVINDMYNNVNKIGESMNKMNETVDQFTKKITDDIVAISSDLTGIIQIIRANREAIFQKIDELIEDLNEEFNEFKEQMIRTTKTSKHIFDYLVKARLNLQSKMQDAELLSVVLELKDVLKKLSKKL